MSTAQYAGHAERVCGEHRTAGAHRAWCFDCGEWCYAESPCEGCAEPPPWGRN